MGALTGSISTSAYYIDEKLQEGFRDGFIEALNKHRFRDIQVEGEDEESWGWVSIEDPFDTELTVANVHRNAYFVFALRQDVLRVPPSLMKLYLTQRVEAYKAEFGKDRITKADKDNVKGLLERELRRKTLPSIKIHDVAWNLDRGELWLFTANKRVCQSFEERFEATFGLNLIPRNPYSRLERHGLDEAALANAARLDATPFAAHGHQRGN